MPPSVPEFIDLLKALDAEELTFVVVGGFAMVLHGSSYVTFDLDLAIFNCARERPS